MVLSWSTALANYDYYADLAKFRDRDEYACGFTTPSFQAQVNGSNTRIFEDSFRTVIEEQNFPKYSIIGEVCFWKIFTKKDPHSLTKLMLNRFKSSKNFNNFCISLHNLSESPTLENFKDFRKICGQPHGFAVPITFLSFFTPDKYPMADSVIARWWCNNKERFGLRSSHEFWPYGMISGQDEDIENNWTVFNQWTNFCQKYASILTSKTQINWRARDVEMAVFHNCQKGLTSLSNLENTSKLDLPREGSLDKKSKINWFENLNNQNKNYSPKQYPYWSTGSGPKRNVFHKK
ncbi:hypothetical protein [Methanoregula sp.]|jgi:hypothetical protein|uniref:hypothetical protein n=1 Tax=Methanoregula sp. TaxID=2052170 RepID=UPI003C278EE2